MMDCKVFGMKRRWLNLRYCPGIRLEGVRTAAKHLSQDTQYLGRDFNPGPPEYGVLSRRNLPTFQRRFCLRNKGYDVHGSRQHL
jgi:hypothetical protein